ncbi:hypothetical protein [Fuerstiella marisgermanici]|uniref:Uncharacterized protein n=1 Tax=Fuerstiella marisgermanici TaxID=1891926 RepID=A0A1P8WPV7_9PLAN|nr:hypothetical protein [Fuerstiella marisgermanici]APZ96087.1 hypothetical protein Fuma_05755 [Fuerstiella marisgermanici]
MTESRIEDLLRQMPLAEPSTELDGRVTASLNAAPVASVLRGRRSVSWSVLTAVAVLCLLIGAVAGHLTGSNQAMAGASSASPQSEPDSTSQSDAAVGVRIVEITNDDVLQRVQGPGVAMLCAMKLIGSNATNEQCLQCHAGLPDAKMRFREQHMNDARFATCMWCHETDETARP